MASALRGDEHQLLKGPSGQSGAEPASPRTTHMGCTPVGFPARALLVAATAPSSPLDVPLTNNLVKLTETVAPAGQSTEIDTAYGVAPSILGQSDGEPA